MATVAPSLERFVAIPLPKPVPPPVTIKNEILNTHFVDKDESYSVLKMTFQ